MLLYIMLQAISITTGLQPRKLLCSLAARYLQFIFKYKVYVHIVVYTVHMISQNIDGGATEADGGACAPV